MTEVEQLIVTMMRDGFAGVHERLDTLNGRTRTLELQVATNTEKLRARRSVSAGVWGGVGIGLAALFKGLFDLFAK